MDGDIIEGSVASILWDIWDPSNDDDIASCNIIEFSSSIHEEANLTS
jgi:hypothetical protein